VEHGDVTAAELVNDALDHIIQARTSEIKEQGGLLVLQDFRAVKTYTSESRQVYIERLKRRARGYSRGVYVATGINPLLRMAVETANLAFSMMIGGAIHMVADLSEILIRHRVRPLDTNAFGPPASARVRRFAP
jgi:hypothetical protein